MKVLLIFSMLILNNSNSEGFDAVDRHIKYKLKAGRILCNKDKRKVFRLETAYRKCREQTSHTDKDYKKLKAQESEIAYLSKENDKLKKQLKTLTVKSAQQGHNLRRIANKIPSGAYIEIPQDTTKPDIPKTKKEALNYR